MTTKVDKFLGGLGIDATNKLEVASNATVTVGNGTATKGVFITDNSARVEAPALVIQRSAS